MHKLFILLTSTALLSACGNEHIDTVKNTEFYHDDTLTLGQAFDNRPVCKSTDWDSFEDDKGRTVVEYNCEITDSGEYWQSIYEFKAKDLEDELNKKMDAFDAEKKDLEERLKSDEEKLAENEGELKALSAKYKAKTLQPNEMNRFNELSATADDLEYGISISTETLENEFSDDTRRRQVQALSTRNLSAKADLEEFNVETVYEMYQWNVTNSGAKLRAGGVNYIYSKSPSKLVEFKKPMAMQSLINQDNIKNMSDYLDAQQKVNRFGSLF